MLSIYYKNCKDSIMLICNLTLHTVFNIGLTYFMLYVDSLKAFPISDAILCKGIISLCMWDKDSSTLWKQCWHTLTLSPPLTTIVLYANSLDPSNSASHPDPSFWHSRQHFNQLWLTLKHFETLWKLKQTRNLADDNLFHGLRVKRFL